MAAVMFSANLTLSWSTFQIWCSDRKVPVPMWVFILGTKRKPEQNGRSWICFFTLLFSAVYSKFLATTTEMLEYCLQHDLQEKLLYRHIFYQNSYKF